MAVRVNLDTKAKQYTYTVSSPWYFVNASGVNIGRGPFTENIPASGTGFTSPKIKGSTTAPPTGIFTISASNYVGLGTPLNITFQQEPEPCYCKFPHPVNIECAAPGEPYPSCINSALTVFPNNVVEKIADNNITTYRLKQATTNELKGDVVLYPNPTTGLVQVASTENIEKITIFDIQGKLVFAQDKTAANTITDIDLSHIVNGLYIVQVTTQTQVVNHKLTLAK
jgi:hypothetical protein